MTRSAIRYDHQRKHVAQMLALLLLAASGSSVMARNGTDKAAFEWHRSNPEDQGMDGARLEDMRESLADHHTTGLLVIRNDRIVCEWYKDGHSADKPHYTASLAKAVVGGVSLAVAISDGLISLNDPAVKFVPQWEDDPRKSKIRVRHLGSHTSGIEDAEADNLSHGNLTGWKGLFWKRLDPPRDPFTLSRDAAPVLFDPGERMQYSNPGIAMLTYCVTAALRDIPPKDIRTLLRDRVMRPIGVPGAEWSVGYGKTYTVEGLPLVASWGGGGYTARAAARVGRLMLRHGNWEGRQLIGPEAVKLVTSDAGTPGNVGMGWWSNNDGSYPELPKDAFWGSGAGHQILLVVPSLNLIGVRNGEVLDRVGAEPDAYHRPFRQYLFAPLMAAVRQTDSPAELARNDVRDHVVPHTRVSIQQAQWSLNGEVTYPGAEAEGLLMDVRMVNSVFEDSNRPDFDPDSNTEKFIARIPEYAAHGVRAFTVNLQGGFLGYEGAVNSAFNPDGSLRKGYLQRVRRVIEACDRNGVVVILGCYYQRQDQILQDSQAVRNGVVNAVRWIKESGFSNVVLEIANEFNHSGFDHAILRKPEGQVELIRLAKQTSPELLVSTSGLGDGRLPDNVAQASDFLLIHFNRTGLDDIPKRIQDLRKYNKPIVCNEDDKHGTEAAKAARLSVEQGASWGFMHNEINQYAPFQFQGIEDDLIVYEMLQTLTIPREATVYFPPPESGGGWRRLNDPDDVRRLGGMDPVKLGELKQWLLESDKRNFAAVVIRNGYIVLEVERGNSSKTDARRVASVSKAICATVLAIASERSQRGETPRRMSFDDPAFDFIPWAQPLSDPRKAKITVRQLLNHTSGICPEATGARNDGTWQYILGHSGDERTAKLAFDPGTACGYSTHALAHAALVCENVTGKPYDEFAVEALFKPIGCEHWWFQYYDGGKEIGRHPSHGMGMPARDLARIAYCMLRNGRWNGQQVIPEWFVVQTGRRSHDVTTREMRFQIPAQTLSLGWELPAKLTGEHGTPSGSGIPADARYKPGSGGQLIAFVPSLDLVVTRQTGTTGNWQYAEYLRRACAAVMPESKRDKR